MLLDTRNSAVSEPQAAQPELMPRPKLSTRAADLEDSQDSVDHPEARLEQMPRLNPSTRAVVDSAVSEPTLRMPVPTLELSAMCVRLGS